MTHSKRELMTLMKRFLADKKRGISIEMFAKLAGYEKGYLREVFLDGKWPLTETLQVRVSKALQSWQKGEVAVMEKYDGTRHIHYRKEPKPRYVKTCRLNLTTEGFKLSVGVRNKADYSRPGLDEQMGKR